MQRHTVLMESVIGFRVENTGAKALNGRGLRQGHEPGPAQGPGHVQGSEHVQGLGSGPGHGQGHG